MKPTFYANVIAAGFGDYEVVLDCRMDGPEVCRIVMPYEVAAKLAVALQDGIKQPKEENESLAQAT